VRPLTDTVPKPMIPIINKPVMEFLIDLLRQHGFDQIVISTSYLASEIENYFREGSRFGVQIAYSYEGYESHGTLVPQGWGSAGGLKKIQDFSGFFDGTFVVLCGDAIIDLDLTEAVAFHRSRSAMATIVLKDVPREDVSKYGVVQTAADGRITGFQEKPKPEEAISSTINTGIYLFEPEAIDLIPSGVPFDFGSQLFPLLVERQLPFFGAPLPFTWIDIGRTSDYWHATQMILSEKMDFIQMPGRELAPGSWGGLNLAMDLDTVELRGPLYIGSSTAVQPGATLIGPSVVGRNCVIESGARVTASIIGDYTRISGLADVSEKIISGRFCVDRAGNAVDLASSGYAFIVNDSRERRRRWTADQQLLIEFLKETSPQL
jgi:mannose-1-phosphate guanylyltransferase